MASDGLTWQEAISKVLEDSDRPLSCQQITKMIGDRGLRILSGATPSATVRERLRSMLEHGDSSSDNRIQRVSRGLYQFVPREESGRPEIREREELEEDELPEDAILVPAFGLYWEREIVNWKKRKVLGRQGGAHDAVNFADQQGVYLLHKDRSIVYVGRTEKGLFTRLQRHNRDSKSMRWNTFSWFGFRDVSDKAELKNPRREFDLKHVIILLEAVLIEALQPPVNGQQGDHMGQLYEQVRDSETARQQSHEFLQKLVG